jgi:hypothetical protein
MSYAHLRPDVQPLVVHGHAVHAISDLSMSVRAMHVQYNHAHDVCTPTPSTVQFTLQ